ncbi:hypothetical protein DFH08DRAFT_1085930 [Mycena albidolilacea]|uniref:DUF6534 domain-containing protein n=1 Tax=Mycena albidolilacea TaxID=1033008 RepID=A0AAD6ZG19_9AGAR|nr:hypothetical protein DFH08DRAFT_1085930 [Mycena albidolilacea]
MLLGVIVNTYLTGVIMSQFFSYWSSSHKDPWWIRSLVAFLFIINATQACAVVYLSWFYCVTNFANPQIVGTDLWPYPLTNLTTAILAITNQMFQSWRIYKLTGNKIFVAFLAACSLTACGMGVAGAIEMSLHVHGPAKLVTLRPIVEGELLLQCCVDVIIAVHLSLIFCRSKTSFARTDRVLNILIRNAVQLGSFTAIFALGIVLAFRLSSDTSMLVLFSLPIGRIYTHTMMDQLVSREELTAILLRTTSSMFSNSSQISAEQSNGGAYAGGSHELGPVPFLA